MRTKHFLFYALIAILCTTTSFSYASKLDIKRWNTSNNIPVYFIPLPDLPMVDIKVVFKVGSIHDGKLSGLARMTASQMRNGTKNKDVLALNEAINRTGASMGLGASHDRISVSFRSLTEEIPLNAALDLLVEILSSPSFPQEELDLSKKRTLQTIRTQNEKPGHVLNRTFGDIIYANHPYSIPALGSKESVPKITRKDMQRYYKNYFVQANMTIIGGGALSQKAFADIAERLANIFPQGKAASAITPLTQRQSAQQVFVPFPSEQAHVRLGQIISGFDAYSPDRFALSLGNHILGGSGFGSRLVEEVRVKNGFAYSVRSGIYTNRIFGSFSVTFQTRSDQAEDATALAKQVVKEFVENGPTDEEIALAKENIKNKFAYSMISNSAIVGAVNGIAEYNRRLDYFDVYLARFETIDAKQVHAAFKKYINPDEFITVTVGKDQTDSP